MDFPGRLIFIQLPPGLRPARHLEGARVQVHLVQEVGQLQARHLPALHARMPGMND